MPERNFPDRSRINRERAYGTHRGKAIPPRVVMELDGKALQDNYKAIAELVPEHSLMPMIKADAYGHGMEWAANLLHGFSGLYGFGVATLEEGAELRGALGVRARKTRIVVCSGATAWSDEKGQFCEQNNLTPVITTDDDWKLFLKGDWPGRIPYQLKFNTGMNRLGMSDSLARQVVRTFQGKSTDTHPDGFLSHMAMSDDAESRVTQMQLERFLALKSELVTAFPSAQFHVSNSGAIWNHKRLGINEHTDVVRPGIALYGVPPWPGAPERGIRPVMTVKARVIALHELKPGESIGYGATYKVPTKASSPVCVAILSAGYADGIARMLSNQGHAWLNGRATQFLGIVSMDLSAVAASSDTRVGDLAEIMGANIDPWGQARAAGTIPYELLTSFSSRVQRQYV